MMSEEPVAKKCRVWNPALDDSAKMHQAGEEQISPIGARPQEVQFCGPQFAGHHQNIPFFINNYFQLAAPLLAHFQQQQQLHASGVQKAFLEQLAVARNMKQAMLRGPVFPPTPHGAPPMHAAPPQGTSSHAQPPTTAEAPTTSGRSANPIVLSTIAGTAMPINQNCCAICGASFRLTGDLVQHMRSNHRNSKYRRRNQHSGDSH